MRLGFGKHDSLAQGSGTGNSSPGRGQDASVSKWTVRPCLSPGPSPTTVSLDGHTVATSKQTQHFRTSPLQVSDGNAEWEEAVWPQPLTLRVLDRLSLSRTNNCPTLVLGAGL